MMLRDKQFAAVDLIVAGQRGKDIEASVGVSHAQLHRWRHDPEFIAALERERLLCHQERVERFWKLGAHAMEVADQLLDEGDPKMATDILKLLAPGLGDINPIPATLPEETEPLFGLPSGGKPNIFSCDLCGKECKSAGALGSHRRTHEA